MPYDPTKPTSGTPLSAEEMRNQLQGLAALIAAIPAGPQGPPGPAANSAAVDFVGSQPNGNAATASASIDGLGTIRFQFNLVDGPTGPPGEVTASQLSNELSNAMNESLNTTLPLTSSNSNSVSTLDTPLATGELELLRQKLNELILALRR